MRAVVMPKMSIDTTVNRGRFFMLKIGERSQRGAQEGSGTQDYG